jgi:hypothetical protein
MAANDGAVSRAARFESARIDLIEQSSIVDNLAQRNAGLQRESDADQYVL